MKAKIKNLILIENLVIWILVLYYFFFYFLWKIHKFVIPICNGIVSDSYQFKQSPALALLTFSSIAWWYWSLVASEKGHVQLLRDNNVFLYALRLLIILKSIKNIWIQFIFLVVDYVHSKSDVFTRINFVRTWINSEGCFIYLLSHRQSRKSSNFQIRKLLLEI